MHFMMLLYNLFLLMFLLPPRSTLFPYTTLFRSTGGRKRLALRHRLAGAQTSASSESRPRQLQALVRQHHFTSRDRKSTRLNSSHTVISYAVFCLKKKSTTLRRRNRLRHDRSPDD